MKDTLDYLFEGNSLSKAQAQDLLTRVGEGQFSEAEIAALLTVFRMRKIKGEEMAGFRQAMLNLCIPVDFSDYNTIDVVGTGGDGKNTFNISTLSCFVLAGAGYKVTKHGNYGLSSVSGSSNMFEYFGYQFSNDTGKLRREVEETGLTFFHAPLFHPAMKYVGPVRKALKVRTIFNIMGPIMNPSSPKNQLIGVSDLEIMDLYDQAMRDGDQQYMIVHSLDGYDEVSLTAETRYVSDETEDNLAPADFGFEKLQPEELSGGHSVVDAAKIFVNILEGNGTEAQQNVVIANAALGIKCMFRAKSLADCVAEASDSLKSKKAQAVFKKLFNQ
ncbi:anthranilate phosphoribosyltransferase [Sunxiuqinia dokdonensis]|uniref:Anthranilate phosphoribosyltransferase n=1 Tax=Sunxiuqinia dokdonensis TaxID=1409788 RepID=A0A0L8VDH3_9BACT|nr:anthranilate phosphoribosyltransferase [Sunxiuqinia dokdonensis]KOH46408.1 anthranilate phosphoribosyltransferase [Sunxiuqinia dokdonensis]